MSQDRFAISYAPGLLPLFNLVGIGPRHSYLEVGGQAVRVKMGWSFTADIPRTSIRSIEPDTDRVTGWGVHGWGGTWLVNGSAAGLLRLNLDPPVPARVTGFPVRLRTLRVSVEEPDSLLRTLVR